MPWAVVQTCEKREERTHAFSIIMWLHGKQRLDVCFPACRYLLQQRHLQQTLAWDFGRSAADSHSMV